MTTQNFKYATVSTQFITASNGIKFAYRKLGKKRIFQLFISIT